MSVIHDNSPFQNLKNYKKSHCLYTKMKIMALQWLNFHCYACFKPIKMFGCTQITQDALDFETVNWETYYNKSNFTVQKQKSYPRCKTSKLSITGVIESVLLLLKKSPALLLFIVLTTLLFCCGLERGMMHSI